MKRRQGIIRLHSAFLNGGTNKTAYKKIMKAYFCFNSLSKNDSDRDQEKRSWDYGLKQLMQFFQVTQADRYCITSSHYYGNNRLS